MHLLETEFPRIFASEDAICRWRDPWFRVIDKYAPPGRNIAVVSALPDVQMESGKETCWFGRFFSSKGTRLRQQFNVFAKDSLRKMMAQVNVPHGFHTYDMPLDLSVLLVQPTALTYRDDLCLLHECGHAVNMSANRDWIEIARNEIQAEAFSYAIYGECIAQGYFQVAAEDASVTEWAFRTQNVIQHVHLPGSGPYLQAAQGNDTDMMNMSLCYVRLYQQVQKVLGFMPQNAHHLMDAAQEILDRTPLSAPIIPYAEHLLRTQRFALGLD